MQDKGGSTEGDCLNLCVSWRERSGQGCATCCDRNVTKQYLNSHAYKSLPDNAEQLKKSKKPSDPDDDMFKEDEESDKDEDFELSYSIDSTGYQEATIENDSDVTFSA